MRNNTSVLVGTVLEAGLFCIDYAWAANSVHFGFILLAILAHRTGCLFFIEKLWSKDQVRIDKTK